AYALCEQLFALVDQKRERGLQCPFRVALPRLLLGRARERTHDRLRRRRPSAFEIVGKSARRRVVTLCELGQSLSEHVRQRCDGARLACCLAVTWLHPRHAPEVDRGHDTWRGQARDQAGTRERGFARAARAYDQQERRAAVGRADKSSPRLLDGPVAAEEHARLLGLEGRQAWKRRALFL